MKNNFFPIGLWLVALAVLVPSCTKDFDEINTDPASASADLFNPNYLITSAQLGYTGSTDFAFEVWRANLIYCSTMMQHISNVNGYWVGDKSRDNAGYESSYFERAYAEQIRFIVDCIELSRDKSDLNNVYQVARIIKAMMFLRLTDLYGDVPYSEAGLGFYKQIYTPVYDTQEDILNDILKELDEAGDGLDPAGDALSGDLMYGSDMEKWRKFANSMMLRTAFRLIKRDAAKAQQWAEKAAAKGVMAGNEDNAFILHDASTDRQTPCRNSIVMNLPYEIPNMRLSATFVDWMRDNADPRLFVFGENPNGNTDPGTTVGMPNGYDLANQPISTAPGYPADGLAGYLAPRLSVIGKMDGPTFIQTFAEVSFLLAEAAHRGWNVGGDAATHYGNGVKAAITHLGQYDAAGAIDPAAADAYLAAHPFDNGNALQQINEQYWACTFLNEYEAFANWRRTGIPNLTPTSFPTDITGGKIPRRLRYPTGEYSTNEANILAAVARQGADNNLTRVWWDSE